VTEKRYGENTSTNKEDDIRFCGKKLFKIPERLSNIKTLHAEPIDLNLGKLPNVYRIRGDYALRNRPMCIEGYLKCDSLEIRPRSGKIGLVFIGESNLYLGFEEPVDITFNHIGRVDVIIEKHKKRKVSKSKAGKKPLRM